MADDVLERAQRRRVRRYPDLTPIFPLRIADAARGVRPRGVRSTDPTTSGRGCGMPPGRSTGFRCTAIAARRAKWQPARQVDDYAFVRVEGDGVHEIPVGPVHAGIIEPGHFRFQVVGEKVLRLEERLGYAHKGIERALRAELGRSTAHRLAGACSGDSTVAYAWAYCAGARRPRPACTIAAARRVAARADARARAHRQSSRRPRRARQRRRLRLRARAVLAAQGGRGCARTTRRSAIAS